MIVGTMKRWYYNTQSKVQLFLSHIYRTPLKSYDLNKVNYHVLWDLDTIENQLELDGLFLSMSKSHKYFMRIRPESENWTRMWELHWYVRIGPEWIGSECDN